MKRTILLALGAVGVAATLAACSGSKSSSPAPTTPSPPPARTTPQPQTTTGPGALQAEAASAATGDIPDNQVFLTFTDKAEGYSIKYPEGWAQRGSTKVVTFRDKNNIARITAVKGSPPSVANVEQQLTALKGARVTTPPAKATVNGTPAIHAVYETESGRNPVTGKTVTLGVDRYYFWNGTKVAIVDLGTPVAPVKVDNVDAYRLIAQSFRWR